MQLVRCGNSSLSPEPVFRVSLALALVAILLLGGILLDSALASDRQISVGSASEATTIGKGDVERGRNVFNGKGICFFCHGRDGYINQLPELSPEATEIIARLDPKPSDLRNPRALKLKTDRGRFRTIREGHSGTAMLPDKQLKDEEIIDLLVYLSTLRRERPE